MSRATPDLVVDSVTGVHVSLAVAGAGARSLAFLIDAVIRVALVVTWYVIASILYHGAITIAPPLDPEPAWYLAVAVPALAIFTLYHTVLEIGMRGRTPGKRMVGVRIVTREGALPSVAAHLVRNVFRLVDSFPVGYGVGLTLCLVTRDQVRVGDLAAGTLLVYQDIAADHAPLVAFRAPRLSESRTDGATLELMSELLERWRTLNGDARARLAHELLSRAGAPGGTSSSGTPNALPEDDDESLRTQLERRVAANAGSARA